MNVLLVAYDNESYILDFPLGLAYIASAIREAGHTVTIYDQAKNHYTEEHLTHYLNNNTFDVIGVSIIAGYFQYKKLKSISKSINSSNQRPFYILGGHGPSPDPKFFMEKTLADAVVMGEGEHTIVNVLKALETDKSLKNIKGIAFRSKDSIIINERQPLIQDIDSISMPAYDLFDMHFYRLKRFPHIGMTDFSMNVLSGRGCKYKCNFCYRMDKGIRPRSPESILEEIEYLKATYNIKYIYFADELLMSSVKRAEQLSQAFIQANICIKWGCNGRLNYAEIPLLNLMKKAGCVFIDYGIESVNDRVLKNMHKGQTVKEITSGIENTLKVGISPGFNMIFGNIGDTAETLNDAVRFLLKYDNHSQLRTIRPVTPYPGSELFYLALEKKALKSTEDFYENKHINSDLLAINFTSIPDDEFHKLLLKANTILIKKYFKYQSECYIDQAKKLYLTANSNFRGFRQT